MSIQLKQNKNIKESEGEQGVPVLSQEQRVLASENQSVEPDTLPITDARTDQNSAESSRPISRFWANCSAVEEIDPITNAIDSDGESFASVNSVSMMGKEFLKNGRKRPHAQGGQSSSDEVQKEGKTRKGLGLRASKAKGRPTTTGQYVGLAQAKRALNEAKREELRLRAEEEVANAALSIRSRRSSRLLVVPHSKQQEAEAATASDLKRQVVDNLSVIEMVATKSGNLKGTFVKALKEAASAIAIAVEVLAKRTDSEEVSQLQAQNARLQSELSELRKEFTALRADLERAQEERQASTPLTQNPASLSVEELVRTIMIQVGNMVNTRFEALEDKLLPQQHVRPPLAVDRARKLSASTPLAVEVPHKSMSKPATKKVPWKPVAVSIEPEETARQAPANSAPKSQKSGKKGGKKAVTQPDEVSVPCPMPSMPSTVSEAWNVVARRGKKSKVAASQQQDSTQTVPAVQIPKAKPKVRKLRAPNSSAVIITLQPKALDHNVTYGKVITEIKNKIDLADLGITSVRFRVTKTDARMIELPEANTGEKADALAEKIKLVLGDTDVRVSRPTKCAVMRISELDDAVSSEEVAVAIAKEGGCSKESVKVGEIRRERSILGTTWVQCPVMAAKKITDGGRLMIGWVSAQVKLLQAHSLRCFRCHEEGHVAAKCSNEVDRSSQCYRCSQPGHIASQCSAEQYCAICAAANKPAGHMVGSTACVGTKTVKQGGGKGTTKAIAQLQAIHPSREAEVTNMEQ